MRLQDFIDSLFAAGWTSASDAQWTKIAKLHAEIFPVIAQLEVELEDANNEILEIREAME